MSTKYPSATRSTLISLSMVKEENPIVIKVQGQKQADMLCYRMGRNTPLIHLMLDYCDRTGAVFESIRFHYDDLRISPEKTADDLKMEDGDIIAANSLQLGGCHVPY
ncbi:hypothetical protein REPUB_Repub13aG0129200 [Reevesia pubescens]